MDPRLTQLRRDWAAAVMAGNTKTAAAIEETIGAIEARERGGRSALHGERRALPVVERGVAQGTPLPAIPRICATCIHFRFTSADHGYSTWTPGTNVDIRCDQGVWEVDVFSETEVGYREKMLLALICEKYVCVV